MIEFAKKLAVSAGKHLLELSHSDLDFHFKKDGHVVTNADAESEELIIQEIENNFPEHSIYSEETGVIDKESEYIWIIDPLDGTNNYLRKLGHYSVSIALSFKQKIALGVVYNPKTQELFHVEKGRNAFLNNEKIMVNNQMETGKSLIYVSNLGKSMVFLPKLMRLFGEHNVRTLTSTAYELCSVAVGRAEGFIKVTGFSGGKGKFIGKEDIAAASLLVEEAGGMVTDLEGNSWTVDSTGMVASNRRIHDKLLKGL